MKKFVLHNGKSEEDILFIPFLVSMYIILMYVYLFDVSLMCMKYSRINIYINHDYIN